jgi:hypothetical protein
VQDHATIYDDISKLDTMSRFCLEKAIPFTLWKRDVSKAFRKAMIAKLHWGFAASIFVGVVPYGSSSTMACLLALLRRMRLGIE